MTDATEPTKEDLKLLDLKKRKRVSVYDMEMYVGHVMEAIGQAVSGELSKLKSDTEKRVQALSSNMQTIFWITRRTGIQVDAVVRAMETMTPGAKETFTQYEEKLGGFCIFLDKFTDQGEFAGRSMRERLELVREWNSQDPPPILKMSGPHFGLIEYIFANPTEFTPEEKKSLGEEFGFELPAEVIDKVPGLVAVPELVEDNGDNPLPDTATTREDVEEQFTKSETTLEEVTSGRENSAT